MDKTTTDRPLRNLAEAAAGSECAKRERTWDECPLEVKIERLRQALRFAAADAIDAGKVAHKAYEVSHLHQHGGEGRVVMPVAIDAWGNQANQIICRDYASPRRLHLLD